MDPSVLQTAVSWTAMVIGGGICVHGIREIDRVLILGGIAIFISGLSDGPWYLSLLAMIVVICGFLWIKRRRE
ncbi:MAG: hypothetical protein ACK55O_03960 [Phycisphaerales bacterium]|jgi:hypothetical protein|nr:hypothetical protein [Phycisphaeraceae bacterium]